MHLSLGSVFEVSVQTSESDVNNSKYSKKLHSDSLIKAWWQNKLIAAKWT